MITMRSEPIGTPNPSISHGGGRVCGVTARSGRGGWPFGQPCSGQAGVPAPELPCHLGTVAARSVAGRAEGMPQVVIGSDADDG